MLINKSLEEYIELSASKSPTPGGGSVSALASSLGGALTGMVGKLSTDKKDFKELDSSIKEEFNENFDRIEEIVSDLKVIIDEDAKAFDKVIEGFKMPKDTEEEKKKRSQAIQDGYKVAMEVPLRSAKLSLEILRLQEVFARYGNVNAITDVGVATLLLYSGLEGSLLNVKINLASVKDSSYKEDLIKELESILSEAKERKEDILKIVYERLN